MYQLKVAEKPEHHYNNIEYGKLKNITYDNCEKVTSPCI